MERVTYVLDTSALIRFLQRQAEGSRVESLLDEAAIGVCEALISAVNWGELVYPLTRICGAEETASMLNNLRDYGLRVIPVTDEHAERAALLKTRLGMGYADCFRVELAADLADHILVTADFGVKAAEEMTRIEFLPPKDQP